MVCDWHPLTGIFPVVDLASASMSSHVHHGVYSSDNFWFSRTKATAYNDLRFVYWKCTAASCSLPLSRRCAKKRTHHQPHQHQAGSREKRTKSYRLAYMGAKWRFMSSMRRTILCAVDISSEMRTERKMRRELNA